MVAGHVVVAEMMKVVIVKVVAVGETRPEAAVHTAKSACLGVNLSQCDSEKNGRGNGE
jgi:hypothetical protein